MKNFAQKNPVATFIVLIVAIVIVIVALDHHSRVVDESSTVVGPSVDTSSSTSTDMASSSAPEVAMVKPTLAFSVTIATSTYRQDQVIPIIVSVLNLTDASTTLSFKNGCAGDYSIGSFDMLAHTTCLASSTSFIVAPHGIRQVGLAHYPSVYKIPAGKYTLHASIVGYGGNSVPITITQ